MYTEGCAGKESMEYHLNIEGRVRKDILDAARSAGKAGAHIAPSLSIVEIALAVLQEMGRGDKFILSKGHGALGYYAAMHQAGRITHKMFASFASDGGDFPGQPSRSATNCIDYSSGSLGMGLSYAAGLAYADRGHRCFVILGDGEADEGSVWEAAGAIKKHGLHHVTALVDHNGMQSDGKTSDIVGLDLASIWKAYGWKVAVCDGHDTKGLADAIRSMEGAKDAPLAILAKTVKGKGVSFMENKNEWHHHELSQEDYDKALREVGERYGLR